MARWVLFWKLASWPAAKSGAAFGDRLADGLDPARLRFGEVAQDISVDQRLVAGVANADPHPLIAGADMGGDRA